MKRYCIFFCLLGFIFITNIVYANETLAQEGVIVTLSGKITTALAYGPPNFGENPETDSKDEYIVLTIREPISIKGSDGVITKGITRIQLAFLPESKGLLNKIGQDKISITGKITLASSPYHHESSIIFVKSFTEAEKKSRPPVEKPDGVRPCFLQSSTNSTSTNSNPVIPPTEKTIESKKNETQ